MRRQTTGDVEISPALRVAGLCSIARAYRFSEKAHTGQKRASGEDYLATASRSPKILADLHLDSILARGRPDPRRGRGHDITLDDVEGGVRREIASIVDGVTKIGKVQFRSTTEQQVENYRKLLLSMAQDARVITIKLADRLHNMRTLEHLRTDKRRRIALETREIYAPLAHRLGMAQIRWELEDLAFKHLEPDAYRELAKKIADRRRSGRSTSRRCARRSRRSCATPASRARSTAGRSTCGRSTARWCSAAGPYDEIYDLMAIRVVTDNIANCYHALGVIHNKWTPLQERFHDYIATPKSNMYRSLHTTIFGPGGRLYEIQIRTHEMHRTAEYGIAAHWRYKEGGATPADEVDETLSWFRQVLEWQQDTREPEEFMEFLRIDLFQDEIFVFTPKGDVKQLPRARRRSTSRSRCTRKSACTARARRINGRIAPLSRELKNGDTVEVMTDARQKPSRDWLAFVKTARARQKIRHWIKQVENESALELGSELFTRELRKARKDGRPSEAVLQKAAAGAQLRQLRACSRHSAAARSARRRS
jgi:GTP diphosphokinase / guanosine-3',5'-bis(diphosphate) 3'-diphosphatase